jgi:hypothetical protein
MFKTRSNLFFAAAIIVPAILFIQFGCKHDPEVFSDVCFESEILPIFQNNCAVSGCHNQETALEDLVLDSYDNIMAQGITAGDAKNSRIYKAISRNVGIMPPGRKLSGNQIALIYSWIQGGAQNTTGCGCDTLNVKYSTTIAPIFSNHCLLCHGTDSIRNFSNYLALNSYLDSNSQKMINNINNVSGFSMMPPTGKLDACTINKITKWIHNGHLND